MFGGLALLLGTAFYLPLTLLAPLKASAATIAPYETPVTATPEIDFPDYGATAVGAVGFDGLLAQGGTDAPVPMASITKVVTALVVLEAKPLGVGEDGPTITFTSRDNQIYNEYVNRNGSVKPVRAGLVLTQRQVLDLTLISSANNYTQALVNWAFGSEEAFLPIAASWLAEKGLGGIILTDSTGMNPENTATAAQLVELGKLALQNDLVAEITSTQSKEIPGVGSITNTNKLLGVDGITGFKTGMLTDTGSNLLFTAEYPVGEQTVTVVGVMLGGKNKDVLNADIQSLLATVRAGFQELTLTTTGQNYGSYTSLWGDASDLVAAADARVVVWGETPVSLDVEASPVSLVSAGTTVGLLTFTVGTATVEVPLEMASTIDDPGVGWRLSHPAELF